MQFGAAIPGKGEEGWREALNEREFERHPFLPNQKKKKRLYGLVNVGQGNKLRSRSKGIRGNGVGCLQLHKVGFCRVVVPVILRKAHE